MADFNSALIANRNNSRYTPNNLKQVHGRMRYTGVAMELDVSEIGDDDDIRLIPIRSNWVPIALLLSVDSGLATATVNVGIRKGYGGGAISASSEVMFGPLDLAGGHTRNERRFGAGTTGTTGLVSVGFTFWELVNAVNAGTYTADPREEWDIALNTQADLGGADSTLAFELYYLARD